MINPYLVGPPVGRHTSWVARPELDQAKDLLASPVEILAIRGHRRSGKTSLLQRLQDAVRAELAPHARFVDLEPYRDGSFHEPIRRFLDAAPDDGRCVLLLDELDALGEVHGDELANLLQRERQQLAGQLTLVVAIGRMPDAGWAVPFLRYATQICLRPLPEARARALMALGPRAAHDEGWPEPIAQEILALSGREPFFLQAVCRELQGLLQTRTPSEVTTDDLEGAAERALEAYAHSFRFIWDGMREEHRSALHQVVSGQPPIDGSLKELRDWFILDDAGRFRASLLERFVRARCAPVVVAPPTAHARRFRVALSFPRAQRALVREVAAALSARWSRAEVLFDEYHEAEFNMPNLDLHLPPLYAQADIVAVFFDHTEPDNHWCGLEWRTIRASMLVGEDSTRLILLSATDTIDHVPGLDGRVDGFSRISQRTAAEVGELITTRYAQRAEVTP